MRIQNLVENTEGCAGCGAEHGLSFYVETQHHCLLMDTGASDLVLRNAQTLGIDLARVDTVILSHGHYDHGGGIPAFSGLNPYAKIYLQASAFGDYYSLSGGTPRFIGLAPEIRGLPQVIPVAADASCPLCIDEELILFWGIGSVYPIPAGNRALRIRRKDTLVQDDFRHEQCLVIRQDDQTVLLSGCAHHGILNILDRYRELSSAGLLPEGDPDIVISGFHMMKKDALTREDVILIEETAQTLNEEYAGTRFYTCHCTGLPAYDVMRAVMGEQLRYIHCGDVV